MFVPLTPLEFKRRAVQLFGDKAGVIDGDRRFTYREFGGRTARLANALRERGLKQGDRVAYLAYNSYPLLEGYYGVLEAGGILLPLNIRLSPDEIAYILEDSGARFLLADPDFLPMICEVLPRLHPAPEIIWLGFTPEGRDEPEYEEVLGNASPEERAEPVTDENAVAELFYTSGTTGRPKGVMLTHRNLYLHALGNLIATGTQDKDVQLHTIPLFHVNGWGTPQSVTCVGGTHVMMRRFDPGEALRLIESEQVTQFYAVPTMLTMLLNHPDVGQRDLSSLRTITAGGAPIPPEMLRRTEQVLGCEVIAGYGLSETSPVLSHARTKHHLRDQSEELRITRQASTGLPVIGTEVRIVHEAGSVLPRDGEAVGEIQVRSNAVTAGYWNDDEATEAALSDGWFRTGDMATIDGEGYILIVDRKKDIIVSGGENISSVEIEKVLYEHPAVLEVAVIGVPDEQWGEVSMGLVALKPGASATADDLLAFCRQRLASFKVPQSIDFLESLPKGGTGKILKRELREPFWAGHGKRVH